jgi:hypothetical protein
MHERNHPVCVSYRFSWFSSLWMSLPNSDANSR